MGYCYDNSGRLCCDCCGASSGATRKCTCPHKVRYLDGSSLPYCPAPALCPGCLEKHGGRAKIHEKCKAKAADRTQREMEKGERFRAGEHERSTAWGDWHEKVPAGLVGVRFHNPITRENIYKLIPADHYSAHQWLSEFEPLQDWTDHPDLITKEVTL